MTTAVFYYWRSCDWLLYIFLYCE